MKINSIRLNRRIDQVLKGKLEPYTFEVGVLQNSPHKVARVKSKGHKSFAGVPARKVGKGTDGTMAEISKKVRTATGINYLTKPFQKRTKARILFSNAFFTMAFKENAAAHRKRVENLVQAIVRNPILKRGYGANSSVTKKIKGFDRKFFDTAQLFKSIKARVKVNLRGRR